MNDLSKKYKQEVRSSEDYELLAVIEDNGSVFDDEWKKTALEEIERRGGLQVVRDRCQANVDSQEVETLVAQAKRSVSFTKNVQRGSFAIGTLTYVGILIATKGEGWFLFLLIIAFLSFTLSALIDFFFNSPLSKQDKLALLTGSQPNKTLVCPHCQQAGFVATRTVKRKKGISGTKATAAVITSGLSILGTGLSRKEKETEAHCSHCGLIWHF